jgi:hypothetical protein
MLKCESSQATSNGASKGSCNMGASVRCCFMRSKAFCADLVQNEGPFLCTLSNGCHDRVEILDKLAVEIG